MAIIWEYDIPKDESRQKKIGEYGPKMIEYWMKLVKEKDIKDQATYYTDNTGRWY